ncbi:MAG: GvpL/GvpF family gas vesicle protein [Candidatus Thermoplasmatota archaeon]|nr:GvpL/GvpF family gas vesicle protein [Candidatus Thermoplasmatota archaeon]
MKKGIYIYGIIEENGNKSFGQIGMDKSEVYTIPYQTLAAVVSNVPAMVYQLTPENARAHENVIRKVMEERSVIPMSFGTVASNGSQVEKILSIGYKVFKSMLERIENKIQIDVKVLWDKDKIYLDILRENENIKRLTRKADKSQEDKIELGKLVNQALAEKREFYIGEIKNVLANFSEPPKENKLTDERMILNLAYLVDKTREQEFYDRVNEKERSYEGKLQIIAVGPLPAYNFTKLELKKLDFKLIDSARKILGLNEEITNEELEEAHRKLAYRYHPDRNPNDVASEQQFKKIEKAYMILARYSKNYPAGKISLKKEDVDKTILILEKE